MVSASNLTAGEAVRLRGRSGVDDSAYDTGTVIGAATGLVRVNWHDTGLSSTELAEDVERDLRGSP
jgi:hypothetical protein